MAQGSLLTPTLTSITKLMIRLQLTLLNNISSEDIYDTVDWTLSSRCDYEFGRQE